MKRNLTNEIKQLLVFEPYVFVNIKKGKALLYDSISGKKLVYSSKRIIDFLMSNKHEFYHYYYLNHKDLENHEIISLIDKVTENHQGFLIPVYGSLPIQFPALDRISSSDSNMQNIFNHEQSIKSINEITISLDYVPTQDPEVLTVSPFFRDSEYTNRLSEELFLDKLNKFLDPILTSGNILRINVLGDVLNYQHLETFVNLIREKDNRININFVIKIGLIKDKGYFIKQLLNKHTTLTIVIKSNDNKQYFISLLDLISDKSNQIELQCIIENEEDINTFNEKLSSIPECEVVYKPYYNGNNFSFFEKNVFLNEENINNLKPSTIDIIKWQQLNPLNFGKLTVLRNGDVYTNIYDNKIGDIMNDSVYHIVEKELNDRKNWLRTRKEVQPCRYCIYELICPPVSNYEYALNQYNLCSYNIDK